MQLCIKEGRKLFKDFAVFYQDFFKGSLKEKVLPFPIILFTETVPPWRFIISEEIYKPSPRPG